MSAPEPNPPFTKLEDAIFDDALAEGETIEKAAKRAGRSALDGYQQFHRICRQLGESPR